MGSSSFFLFRRSESVFGFAFALVVVRVMRLARVIDCSLNQVDHMRVGERIEDVLPRSTSRDDALGPQEPKLLRDRRQSDARRVGKLRHAPLSIAEAMKELQARDITGRTKDRRRALELLFTEIARPSASRVLFRSAGLVPHRTLLGGGCGGPIGRTVRIRMRMTVLRGRAVGLGIRNARHHFTI